MDEIVAATIDRMHAEFTHTAPKGVAIEDMLSSWAAALTRNGVPPESVPQCYDAACDTRTQKGISAFMPTVHDLVAEWHKTLTDEQREQLIADGTRQRREHFENQDKQSATGPIPSFEAQLAKGRAMQEAKRGRRAA